VCYLALAAGLLSLAAAPNASYERGDFVTTILDGVALTAKSEKPRVLNRGTVLEIQAISGNWLTVTVHDPLSSVPHQSRGVIDDKAVINVDEGIEYFNKQIANNRKDVGALVGRGKLSIELLGDYEEGIADFSKAIELDSQNPAIYLCRARAWRIHSRPKEAIEDCDKVLELDPTQAAARVTRGELLDSFGEYQRALADFREAFRLTPKDSSAANGFAWLLATSPVDADRDGQEAVRIATIACELTGWKSAAVLDTLAAAYAETGDFEQAVRWQKKANFYEPDDTTLKDHLALYESARPLHRKAADTEGGDKP